MKDYFNPTKLNKSSMFHMKHNPEQFFKDIENFEEMDELNEYYKGLDDLLGSDDDGGYYEDMTINELLNQYGLTANQLGEMYEIPDRTIRSWKYGERKPPVYVMKMLVRLLSIDME